MVFLYEEIEEPIITEPVSPAPASQIHEPTIPGVEELSFQARMGGARTILLALGAGLGVMGTAGVIHLAKKAPAKWPKGWTRTAILSGGAIAGTMMTAGLIHLARTVEGETLKKYGGVEEI